MHMHMHTMRMQIDEDDMQSGAVNEDNEGLWL